MHFNGYLPVTETHRQVKLCLIGDILERKVNVSTAKSNDWCGDLTNAITDFTSVYNEVGTSD